MNFAFHPEAAAEFDEAIKYYEEMEPGLGCHFALEVYSAFNVRSLFQRYGLLLRVRFGDL